MQSIGCTPIPASLIDRMESLSGKVVPDCVRRNLTHHSQLDEVIKRWAATRQPFYVVVSRGVRRAHLGHVPSMQLAQYLQAAFQAPVIVQCTDDKSFMAMGDSEPTGLAMQLGWEAAAHALSSIDPPLDPARTYVYSSITMAPYPLMCRIWRATTMVETMRLAGVQEYDSVGKLAVVGTAVSPFFPEAFPSLFRDEDGWSCVRVGSAECSSHLVIARSVHMFNCVDRVKSLVATDYVPSYSHGHLPMHDDTGAIYFDDDSESVHRKVGQSSRDTLLQYLWWFSDVNDMDLSWACWNEDLSVLRKLVGEMLATRVHAWASRCKSRGIAQLDKLDQDVLLDLGEVSSPDSLID
jgi:tryptophanyl-tRNA synthetase